MRRLQSVTLTITAIVIVGCHAPVEVQSNHIVHSGELATLECGTRSAIALALDKRDVHALTIAVQTSDEETIASMIQARKVVTVPSGTHVHVQRESYNERGVRIEEGPNAGVVAWIPFEWLKPVVKPVRHKGV